MLTVKYDFQKKHLNAALETRLCAQPKCEGKQHEVMKFDSTTSKMWTEKKNKSDSVTSNGNGSKMVDPDVTQQLLHAVLQKNGSTAADTCPSCTETSLTRTSGIIPGAIAATVFIAFLLALYAVLWKCMVSPPQRKHTRVRVRVRQKTSS